MDCLTCSGNQRKNVQISLVKLLLDYLKIYCIIELWMNLDFSIVILFLKWIQNIRAGCRTKVSFKCRFSFSVNTFSIVAIYFNMHILKIFSTTVTDLLTITWHRKTNFYIKISWLKAISKSFKRDRCQKDRLRSTFKQKYHIFL